MEQAQTQQVISEHKVGTTLAEAYLLFKQGTADSKKQAQDKWNNLLSELRTIGDRKLEAITLHEIGLVHEETGDYWTALSFLKQSQLISRAIHDKLADLVTGIQISTAYENLVARNDPKAKTEFIEYIMQELDRTEKRREDTSSSLDDDITLYNMPWLEHTAGWNPSDK
ncbi:MAG: hypothetical protein KAF91_29955 [Nostoc sp. TH1S01]|nr:hypothetical protein [Nostoc sp. TH1S01]